MPGVPEYSMGGSISLPPLNRPAPAVPDIGTIDPNELEDVGSTSVFDMPGMAAGALRDAALGDSDGDGGSQVWQHMKGRAAQQQKKPASAVSHDEIADHRALVAYLHRTDPQMPDDLARRIAANTVVNPNNGYGKYLEAARRQATPPPNMNYLQDTQRRLDQAHQDRILDLQKRAQMPAQNQRQQPREQTADPQAEFMTRTAPLAARLVKQTGLDPTSAALIAAQLYGAKPYATQPSDAEIRTGVNQALGQLTNPQPQRKQ